MLFHPPGQDARRDLQEVQIVLELVEDVVDQFLTAQVMHVVSTAAATQKDLCTVVLAIAVSVAGLRTRSERTLGVLACMALLALVASLSLLVIGTA